jgi:hypothetical protein
VILLLDEKEIMEFLKSLSPEQTKHFLNIITQVNRDELGALKIFLDVLSIQTESND